MGYPIVPINITPSTGTITIANGKTFTVNNTLTLTGTDGSSVAFGAGGTVVYTNVATLSSLASIGTITTGVWAGSIITSAYGGTGNGFTKFTGPASSEKTFTLPNASDTVACLGQVQAFSKQQTLTPQALTSTSNSIAWDANSGNNASHTATENTTLANPTNLVTGTVYTFQWTQNASAAKTLAFGNKWKFAGSSTVSTTLSAVNIITGLYDGTNINSTMTGPFS